ncbi:MAG: hypothetical protein ABI605_16415 [Rhizobacter sp.]
MVSTRTLRKAVGRLLIGVLLFTKLAVAGYACPSLNGIGSMAIGSASETTVVAAVDAAAMPPGCDQLDRDAPNVCMEHCQQGHQSADTAAAPVVGLGVPTLLYSLPIEPQHLVGSGRSLAATDARLDAAPEPPHAILHCVFRT